MSLREYTRKRHFDRTPEPPGHALPPKGARLLFVVQLHHARRRHYDFRLQVGNALKSWACPKGPSYDPAVKRLAVEVEDHPVSYAQFQGDIPDGYGAGHVDTFDKGVWSTDEDPTAQLKKGHLRFELFGERLKGRWHLVRGQRREKKPAWFLIHDRDEYASKLEADDLLDRVMLASTRRAAGKSGGAKDVAEKLARQRTAKAPAKKRTRRQAFDRLAASLAGARKLRPDADFFSPMLARLHEHAPAGDDWLHEVKWDGYRILTTVVGGKVQLWSRNGLPWTDKLPDVAAAIDALGLTSARFDGELVALDGGQADFNALQQTLSGERAAPLVYVLFDLPYLEGYDLCRVPLLERKRALEAVLKHAPKHLLYSAHVVGRGAEVFARAVEQRLEGIMSKRADSAYHGGRDDRWVKVKRLEADEFAVVGYTEPKGSREGFGSLLLARPGRNDDWYYVGRVGSGFTDAMLRTLARRLGKQKGQAHPPIPLQHHEDAPRGARWLRPSVVVEVYYRGLGNHGVLRQASLKEVRADKTLADLRDADRRPVREVAAPSAIRITHPDRVVYPADGYTKEDVVAYYQAVMRWFLPGVMGRPTSILRFPDGIAHKPFFQKHVPQGGLRHVDSARLKEESGAAGIYLVPQEADAIIELMQYNAIEFHPWGALATAPDEADRVVFDLDPAPDVSWPRVVAAARLTRRLLKQLGLQSFLRTTGGKGLHVVVPLSPASPWAQAKAFARGFAEALSAAHPGEFVAVSTKLKRPGKIFVDYLRNGRGATAVASYSLRGRPGAPVATPLRWQELGKIRSAAQFDLRSVVERLRRLRSDPWEGLAECRQGLDDVIQRLARTRL